MSILSILSTGCAMYLALILWLAGALKVADPAEFGETLSRLIPSTFWVRIPRIKPVRAAIGVGAFEILLGIGLLLPAPVVAMVLAVVGLLTFCAFSWAIEFAIRRGISCGCFGRLSRTRAGGAERGRGAALVLAALFLTSSRILLRPGVSWIYGLASVPLFLGLTAAATHLGGRYLSRRQPAAATAPLIDLAPEIMSAVRPAAD